MLYFAHGTTMNLEDLGSWCESHKIRHVRILSKQPAILKDFQLLFNYPARDYHCGGTNVQSTPGSTLEGVLYKIPDEDFWIIKKKDGVPGSYDEYPDPVTVTLYDGTVVPRVRIFYVPEARCQPNLKPSQNYMDIVIQGAQAEKLNPAYIQKLLSIPTMEILD